MILVDSSVWIEFFNSRRGPAGDELEGLIDAGERVVIAGLIAMEVLQGVYRDTSAVMDKLAEFELIEPEDLVTYINAATLVRDARRRGVTIGTVDAIVATMALAHGADLFTLDRDFQHLRFSGLRLYNFTSNRG